jgi:hypothetical protein
MNNNKYNYYLCDCGLVNLSGLNIPPLGDVINVLVGDNNKEDLKGSNSTKFDSIKGILFPID